MDAFVCTKQVGMCNSAFMIEWEIFKGASDERQTATMEGYQLGKSSSQRLILIRVN
jgi:hypothetical protein